LPLLKQAKISPGYPANTDPQLSLLEPTYQNADAIMANTIGAANAMNGIAIKIPITFRTTTNTPSLFGAIVRLCLLFNSPNT